MKKPNPSGKEPLDPLNALLTTGERGEPVLRFGSRQEELEMTKEVLDMPPSRQKDAFLKLLANAKREYGPTNT